MKRYFVTGVMGLALAAAAAAAPAKKKPAPKPAKPTAPASKPAAKPARPMGFVPAELDLAPGETYLAQLFVPSPTGKAFQGNLVFEPGDELTVIPDPRWSGKIPPWGVKTFPKITASRNAGGDLAVVASVTDGASARLAVHVARPAVELVPGLFKITVRVTSPFRGRQMNGRVMLSNRDRFLEDVTSREFRLEPGKTQELVIPLPGAAPVDGETYDFEVTVETYHGYREKKVHSVSFPPHT